MYWTKYDSLGCLLKWRFSLWVLSLCSLCLGGSFLFFHRLGDRDLWSSHEGRAGMDAQTLLERGDGLPRLFSGEVELQKPPLYYWLVAAVAWVHGGAVDAWAVRLPAALAGLASVVGVAAVGWVRGRRLAGLLAAAVLATAAYFTLLARTGRIDMPLTLCVGGAVTALYLGRRFSSFWLVLIAYVFTSLGVLLKGPIGAVLPAAVTGLHLLMEGDLPPPWRFSAWGRLIHRFGLWWGAPLVLALTLPYFLWLDSATHGDFFRVFVLRHNVERGLGGPTLKTYEWWFYFRCFPADFLPWSPLLLPAAFLCWRRGNWGDDPDARFGLAWFVAVFAVLSCASFKRADYLLPAYPGAALFLGCVAEREIIRLQEMGRRIAAAGLASFVPVLAVGMAVGQLIHFENELRREEAWHESRAFAGEVRRRAPAPAEVVFFRTEAHALAFNIGKPASVLVEWRDLSERLRGSGGYVVTPPTTAKEARMALPDVDFVEETRNTALTPNGKHEHPLVLLRAAPAKD
jgi:4-amino-4-deoxy-L-arabinose transferase-like glycosyltransferase